MIKSIFTNLDQEINKKKEDHMHPLTELVKDLNSFGEKNIYATEEMLNAYIISCINAAKEQNIKFDSLKSDKIPEIMDDHVMGLRFLVWNGRDYLKSKGCTYDITNELCTSAIAYPVIRQDINEEEKVDEYKSKIGEEAMDIITKAAEFTEKNGEDIFKNPLTMPEAKLLHLSYLQQITFRIKKDLSNLIDQNGTIETNLIDNINKTVQHIKNLELEGNKGIENAVTIQISHIKDMVKKYSPQDNSNNQCEP